MSFVYLGLAILFEVLGTTFMKLSDGLTKPGPAIGMLVFYGIGFLFLALSLKRLEVSAVYAIWSGVGTALIALIGVLLFKESLTAIKLVSLTLIVFGVIGLNLAGTAQ